MLSVGQNICVIEITWLATQGNWQQWSDVEHIYQDLVSFLSSISTLQVGCCPADPDNIFRFAMQNIFIATLEYRKNFL